MTRIKELIENNTTKYYKIHKIKWTKYDKIR